MEFAATVRTNQLLIEKISKKGFFSVADEILKNKSETKTTVQESKSKVKNTNKVTSTKKVTNYAIWK